MLSGFSRLLEGDAVHERIKLKTIEAAYVIVEMPGRDKHSLVRTDYSKIIIRK